MPNRPVNLAKCINIKELDQTHYADACFQGLMGICSCKPIYTLHVDSIFLKRILNSFPKMFSCLVENCSLFPAPFHVFSNRVRNRYRIHSTRVQNCSRTHLRNENSCRVRCRNQNSC